MRLRELWEGLKGLEDISLSGAPPAFGIKSCLLPKKDCDIEPSSFTLPTTATAPARYPMQRDPGRASNALLVVVVVPMINFNPRSCSVRPAFLNSGRVRRVLEWGEFEAGLRTLVDVVVVWGLETAMDVVNWSLGLMTSHGHHGRGCQILKRDMR